MSKDSEAQIAAEILKFLKNGSLYNGFKPVLWSVVEATALADAEVEYTDHKSNTIFANRIFFAIIFNLILLFSD